MRAVLVVVMVVVVLLEVITIAKVGVGPVSPFEKTLKRRKSSAL